MGVRMNRCMKAKWACLVLGLLLPTFGCSCDPGQKSISILDDDIPGQQHEVIQAVENQLGGRAKVVKDSLEVYLHGSRVTDDGLAHLAHMTNVTGLYIQDTLVTDAGLVHLAGLTSLKELDLTRARVTDEGLVHLEGLINLEELVLSRTLITDDGLASLAGFKKLIRLDLSVTKVSDKGIVHLKNLPSLRAIHLGWTRITDVGLARLGKTRLTWMSLKGTRVTENGLKSLKRANQKLKIDR